MGAGGRVRVGRRLVTAMLAAPRILRDDLWTAAADPLPRLGSSRWPARLPQALVMVVAALTFSLHTAGNAYGPNKLGMLVAGLQAGALVMAMYRPVPGWWMVTAGTVAGAVMVTTSLPWSLTGMVTQAGVLFVLALRVRPRAAAEALVISVLAGLASTGLEGRGTVAGWGVVWRYTDVWLTIAVMALAALLGAVLRGRRVAHTQLTAQAEVTAEERARRTVLEERSRIARELHDVVAHHLAVISIQAQAAPHLVADPPAELRENLASIRQNAKEALIELRRVLGVLRQENVRLDDVRDAPQPTLDRIDELIGNVRSTGLAVTFAASGEPRPLPQGVEVSAFRIVQEALSNAIRHAPGATARVAIAYQPANVVIRVSNDAPPGPVRPSPGGGHGLLGMRERVTMLGGELAAGPTADGGYEVAAILPVPAGAPAADPAEETV